jgi:hypothetical protein
MNAQCLLVCIKLSRNLQEMIIFVLLIDFSQVQTKIKFQDYHLKQKTKKLQDFGDNHFMTQHNMCCPINIMASRKYLQHIQHTIPYSINVLIWADAKVSQLQAAQLI